MGKEGNENVRWQVRENPLKHMTVERQKPQPDDSHALDHRVGGDEAKQLKRGDQGPAPVTQQRRDARNVGRGAREGCGDARLGFGQGHAHVRGFERS
jgi:hypothetical protein